VSPSGAGIVLYQPQIASWPDQKHMTLYTAVSYLPKDKTTPALGVLRVEADTNVALGERLVNFSEFTVSEASFPGISRDDMTAIVDDILAAVPREQRVIALDRVLAMVDTNQVTARNVDGVKADPPPVFFSQTPAVLVNLDGPPIWGPIPGTDLRFAVNTNWDLFLTVEPQSYYLRVDKSWMTASALPGPWRQVNNLPASFSRLPDDGNWSDVRAALKPQSAGRAPTVFVSEKPAELLLLDGAPKYVPVSGTGLQWVSNTDADVFRAGTSGAV